MAVDRVVARALVVAGARAVAVARAVARAVAYGVITPPKEHLLREEQRQLDTIPVTILVKNNPGQK